MKFIHNIEIVGVESDGEDSLAIKVTIYIAEQIAKHEQVIHMVKSIKEKLIKEIEQNEQFKQYFVFELNRF